MGFPLRRAFVAIFNIVVSVKPPSYSLEILPTKVK